MNFREERNIQSRAGWRCHKSRDYKLGIKQVLSRYLLMIWEQKTWLSMGNAGERVHVNG
jgi:hypothetical protein